MTYISDTAKPADDNSNVASIGPMAQNKRWKPADAFLNLYIPAKDGGRPKKIGALKLYANRRLDAELIEFLQADEANVGKLLSKLTADFNAIDPNDDSTVLDL